MLNLRQIPVVLILSILSGCSKAELPYDPYGSRASLKSLAMIHPDPKAAIAVGAVHSAWFNWDGIFALGYNFRGELGVFKNDSNDYNSYHYSPIRDNVLFPSAVKGHLLPTKLAAGFSTTFALTGTTNSRIANLQGWGNNFSNQLGISGNSYSTPTEIIIPNNGGPVRDISSGSMHTLAITEFPGGGMGQLYSWGVNMYGELGRGTATPHSSPGIVFFPKMVSYTKKIAAGQGFSFALNHTDTKGDVLYGWGQNTDGQLGTGNQQNQFMPVPVLSPQGVSKHFHYTEISAGGKHALALGTDGHLYAWGSNDKGQLGLKNSAHSNVNSHLNNSHILVPQRVSLPEGLDQSAAADFQFVDFSAGTTHSVALGSDGCLYAWGNNEYGQLGNGNTENKTQYRHPTRVLPPRNASASLRFVAVNTKYDHTLAVGDDGHIYGWGINEYGQLGIRNYEVDHIGTVNRPILIH